MIMAPDQSCLLDNAELYSGNDAGLWRLAAPFDGEPEIVPYPGLIRGGCGAAGMAGTPRCRSIASVRLFG